MKNYFILFLIFACAWHAQAVQPPYMQAAPDTVWSHFDGLLAVPDTFWNGSGLSGGFGSGLVQFPNTYDAEYSSWSGWACSNMANDTTPGYANQYSAITAGGITHGDNTDAAYGVAYAPAPVAMHFADSAPHGVHGLYLTNSTYAALAMQNGDGFSKKFGGETGDDPDFFKLNIWGMKDGEPTPDTVVFYLADYRFDDNSQDYIVQDWQWVSLSPLGKVDSLQFALASSDMGEWGMNTPAYFCADAIAVQPDAAPEVAQAIEDVTVEAGTDEKQIDLSAVFTDPDNPDGDIALHVKENPNPDLVSASVSEHLLTLAFTEGATGQAELVIEAVSNGKTVTDTFSVSVTETVGLPAQTAMHLRVYPNPGNGEFTLDIPTEKTAILRIYNLQGRLVHKDAHIRSGQRINLHNMPAGTYILRLYTGGNAYQKKIIHR